MVTKELRDAGWKLVLGFLVILVLAAVVVVPYEWMAGETVVAPNMLPEGLPLPDGFPRELNPAESAAYSLENDFGTICGYVLVPLAVLLGVAVVSGEAGSGTIFLLLSKPVNRSRLLLTKYGVGAAVLLSVALLGCVGIVTSAAVRGYPMGQVSVFGAALSVALLWLGSLFVLSTALLMSVLFRNVLFSLTATVVALYAAFTGPQFLSVFLSQPLPRPSGPPDWSYGWLTWLDISRYWGGEILYLGEGVAAVNFVVYSTLAVLPLLAALWLFNRKAF
ncbi:MAG: ABC transporter permease [Rubrobacter sp.]